VARIRLGRGDVDGLDLHYVSAGRGPATLLIHGLGGFAESWRATMAALEPHARVIAFDLPGFGQSAKPRRAYTLDFFARAAAALLRDLGVDRVRLVGHSLGAGVAVAFALAYPERVDRLALLSAAIPGFPLRPSWVFRLLAVRGVGEVLSRLVTPGACLAALERCVVTPCPEALAFLVEHQYPARAARDGQAAYLATLRGIKGDFTTAAVGYRVGLAEWNRPTLLIHGREDPVVPAHHVEAAARTFPRVDLRWLDRCGHFPHLEQPAAVHGWLSEFLLAGATGR
jgi:pimeloyl-ACP methyl ester carboxylesterase